MRGRADLIVRDATIYDGTGAPPCRGDVAVTDGRIVGVGELGGWSAADELAARGLALSPGFIDVHSHDDRALIADPAMAPKASQGVTTVIAGNCGISLAPWPRQRDVPAALRLLGERDGFRYADFAAYLRALDEAPAAVNAACLVGHTTVRAAHMGALDRPANGAETAAMRAAVDEALAAGAVGLSTGLQYDDAFAASPEEVVALAEPLAARGAVYTTHLRDEGGAVLPAMREAFATARAAGVRLVLSHHKVAGPANYGRSAETLAEIARARLDQPVALDVYPYIAGSTVLNAKSVGNATRTVITWSTSMPEAAGRDLDALAAEMGIGVATCMERLQPAGAVYYCMDEADVQRIMAFPGTMIGSDGLPHDARPHPRLWGTFPRVLGHYCRDLGLFPLEDAVQRMTGLPAAEFGLADRGRIALGFAADLVLFAPERIIDRATFEQPTLPAAGIRRVWVNGEAVWAEGAATGVRPGRVLRPHRPSAA